MQARRCDACHAFYDNPLNPAELDAKFSVPIEAPFKLGRGKTARPFIMAVHIFPCIQGAQGQAAPVDLCPACRRKCFKAAGEDLVKRCVAAKPQKGESPHDGRRRSNKSRPSPAAPAAGKETQPANPGPQSRPQPKKG